MLGSCDIDGEPLGGEPEWSFTVNSEYYLPVGNNTEVYFRGLFKYTDDRINTEASAGIGNVADKLAIWRTGESNLCNVTTYYVSISHERIP